MVFKAPRGVELENVRLCLEIAFVKGTFRNCILFSLWHDMSRMTFDRDNGLELDDVEANVRRALIRRGLRSAEAGVNALTAPRTQLHDEDISIAKGAIFGRRRRSGWVYGRALVWFEYEMIAFERTDQLG